MVKEMPSSKAPVNASVHESLQKELALVRKQAEEYLAGWKRAKADYENLRKRTESHRHEMVRAATEEMVRGLLPIVDNMELALHSTAKLAKEKAADASQGVRKGFELILQQLRETLAAQGVSEIRAEGKKFDPAEHEAIGTAAGEEGVCVAEHARGYKLHDKVLRPCRVSVGSKVSSTKA
jgi:molecular chaperone GrpE